MFRQDTTTLKHFARITYFLAAAVSLAAGSACSADGGENGAIEGTWITALTTPAGNMLLTLTVSPLDLAQTRFSAAMQPVNENPTHFGLFPQADRATHWAGHVVQRDLQSYEGKFVSYLTRMVVPGEGATPRSETIAILVLTATLGFTDPNTLAGEATVAAYQADQDADEDGLPDDGETPVNISAFPCTARRFGPTPPPEPQPPAETIEVTVGDEFTISLDSNATTGYSWELTSPLPAWLELIGTEYILTPTDPPIPGGGGVEGWTFRANGAGTATITFEYRRPWETDQPPAERKTFVIIARPARETIEVTVGQNFVISLQSNPTTGYSWELTSPLPTWLVLVGSEYIPAPTDPPMVGSGGVEEWTFRANAAGTATITFEYRRPWEKDQSPAERKTFVIVARAQGEQMQVTVGQDFVISLESNPSTGFSWELTSPLPAWLALIGTEYIPTPTDPPMIGSGGVEEWTFRANAAGTATLTLAYRQPWATNEPPADQKTFVIVAQ
ncbi:MAG: protease inhibitor I42 family protein [Sedimentisphaerales bacterium]|nr:protease inhibitor I42 family protein [Sedimentisphaerales bacterium]